MRLSFSVFILCFSLIAAADDYQKILMTKHKDSPALRSLKACTHAKLGANDRNGFSWDDWRAEIPGQSVVVNPKRVYFGEFDVDMIVSIDGFTWAFMRNVPLPANASRLSPSDPSMWPDKLMSDARESGKMIRLTKLSGVHSQSPFPTTDKSGMYADAVKIEILDQPIDANANPINELLKACQAEPQK
jgi:hypothetical protein